MFAVAAPEVRAAPPSCPPSEAATTPAQREALARRWFDEGVKREAADPEGARQLYLCASTLAERPAIALRLGTVAERLQRYGEAADAFEAYLDLSGDLAPDAAQMREHVLSLRARLVEKPATPPPSPPEGKLSRQEFSTAPSVKSGRPSWIGWSVLGAGGIIAAGGAVLLLDARATSDDVHTLPAGTPWSSDAARGAYDGAKREETIGLIALGVGAAAAAAGIVLVSIRSGVRVAATPTGVSFALTLR